MPARHVTNCRDFADSREHRFDAVPAHVRTKICHCIHDWNDIVALYLMTAAIQGAACALSRVPYHNRQIRGVGVPHLNT